MLRNWQESDRIPFATLNGDPRVVGDFPGVMSPSESTELMEQFAALWAEDGFSYGAIERRADGAFLGMAGITRCPLDSATGPCFEIGWALDYRFWGHGYATEAAKGWLAHGFDSLELPEIIAFTDPANIRSLAVMRRIGLIPDPSRDFDHPDLPIEHPIRRQLFHALTRRQWQTRRVTPSEV